jgi:hypothetical protein
LCHPIGYNVPGGTMSTMRLTATKFKKNIDQILDSVLSNGKSVEIERKGQILKLIPVKTKIKKSKLMNLEPHDTIVGDPESIIHIDWLKEWKEEMNL